MSEDKFHRLGKQVIPKHYELTIRPDLDTFTFTGQVKIDLKILQETTQIELHCLGLNLNKIEYITDKTTVLKPIENRFLRVNESVVFVFDERIQAGAGKLSIEFDGIIQESSNGFYKTKCLSRDGSVRFAAATQFEASYARKAFPCFDEPSFKATYDITIVADKSRTVLSNMPVKSRIDHENGQLATFLFETTPIMSTYLVAFVVGDYDYVEAISEEGILVRVYTPVGSKHLGQFSLQLTVKALKFFTKYFDIGYKLPKLDLIGLGYVDIEAMENYGLLVFKESLLLIDSNNYSAQSRAECALTVCHEIAHQWFGNLVTMEWWTDLWLNEGFATYVEYVSVDAIFPEWNVWNLYSSDHLFRAFNLDALASSHAIEVPVNSPDEISQIFDSISYCKGSSVLRMLNDYMGSEAFVNGLRSYLKRFMFGNATSNDLWDEMDKAAGEDKNVKRLMQVWTKEKGYPLVKVSRRIDSVTKHTILSLEQVKFSPNSTDDNPTSEVIWNIPISVVTKSKSGETALMNSSTHDIDLGIIPETDWIKLNKSCVGFYLADYSKDLFDSLLGGLYPAERFCTPLDRFELIIETFSLAVACRLDAANLMNLIWKFKEETDCYVWITLVKHLEWLFKCVVNMNSDFGEKFRNFLIRLLETIKLKIGFTVNSNDSDQTKLLRANVLYMLALVNDPDFKEFAKKEFFKRDEQKIDADLQKSIFTSVLSDSGTELIDVFIDMYKKCPTPEEKERIALVLGAVRSHEAVQKVLNFAISDVVTLEETIFMIISVASNCTNRDSTPLAWEFIKQNWTYIYARYSESALFGRLLKRVLENFCTFEARKNIQDFFAENKAPEASYAIKQAVEIIDNNATFLALQANSLENYFNSNNFN